MLFLDAIMIHTGNAFVRGSNDEGFTTALQSYRFRRSQGMSP